MTGSLTSDAIITAWETGAAHSPLDRALAMLWAAGGDDTAQAELPLAERDRRLLGLRQAAFGPVLELVTACPDCGTRLELSLEAAQLHDALVPVAPQSRTIAGKACTVRPLTSRDLAAVADLAEDNVAAALRDRLVTWDGARPARLTASMRKTLDQVIDEMAEDAELTLQLDCAECSASWRDQMDVPDHLWTEVEAAAMRLMGDVGEIAAAFGWTEAEILALSPPRRAAYLQIARTG